MEDITTSNLKNYTYEFCMMSVNELPNNKKKYKLNNISLTLHNI